jgi:hypothetical protein
MSPYGSRQVAVGNVPVKQCHDVQLSTNSWNRLRKSSII